MPKYMENKEWFYFDPREWMDRLTDKATEKARKSYLEFVCKTYGLAPNEAAIKIEADINFYRENKGQMKFEEINGQRCLFGVGDENIDFYACMDKNLFGR